MDDSYKVRVTASPGRLDGKAGPRVATPAAISGKFQVAQMQDGAKLVLFSDGSFRNVHNRRPSGLSGRQRRKILKRERRNAQLAYRKMLGAQAVTPTE